MFKKIMVPVDLAHIEAIDKALQVAADLAKHYAASVCYVGVTSTAPTPVAHNPEEYAQKLDELATQQAALHQINATAKAVVAKDPTIDLESALRHAGEELGADLVVIASHVPGFVEHVFSSHAGYLASHETISVLVVR